MTKSSFQIVTLLVTNFLILQHVSGQLSQSSSANVPPTENVIGLPLNSPNRESELGELVTNLLMNVPRTTEMPQNVICREGFDCVPYYLCNDNNVIIKDGVGIIDIRMGSDEGCTDSMKTCCSINNVTDIPTPIFVAIKPQVVPSPSPPILPLPSPSPTIIPSPLPTIIPSPLPPILPLPSPSPPILRLPSPSPPILPLPSPSPTILPSPSPTILPLPSPSPSLHKCGIRNVNGVVVRITGDTDNESQFGEFPWMVAVLRKEKQPTGNEAIIYQCGGSIINPSVILTAAHCVSGLPTNVLQIRAGEWDTKSISEPLPHQDRNVAQVIIHEQFHKATLKNDIALVFLTEPFDLAGNVRPVCLPPLDTSFDDRLCYATGWGKDKFGKEGRNQVILKKIDLPVVPHQECQDALRTTRLSKYFELHDSFICAGGEEGKDTCRGDGGSPLVCTLDSTSNQYYQAGIVAWGIGCSTNNIPGVYTKVSKYRYWIDQIMNSKNLDKSVYVS